MGRTIVIGDIHGCYDELVQLLDKVSLVSSDRVIAVGDLVVKGPKNREVLDLFRSNDRFSSVVGNHDFALVRHARGEEVLLKQSQLEAYSELAASPSYIEYLKSLPFLIDLEKHVIVHAGLRPGVPQSQQSPEDLTELRTLGPDPRSRTGVPWYEVYSEKTALFGHWPAPVPRRGENAIGLDTGCVYGFQLTALIIESGEFVQVQAREAYYRSKPASS